MDTSLILVLLLSPLIPFLLYLVDKGRLSTILVSISGIVELGLAAVILIQNWGSEGLFNWQLLSIANKNILEFGIWINNYSLVFLLVVSTVSLMVRLYSSGYLKNDSRKSWFLVLIGFFTFAMYGIVLSSNLLGIFFFWEWVGLASYLMIGFWYSKTQAAEAARKAFMYNKLGDLGFLMALGIFYFHFESFNIPFILQNSTDAVNSLNILFSIGIIIAAFAKSAQLPFSNWLADAMEGPTPASALIHSATMVTAGIYLLIRCFPFLDAHVLEICMYIAILTVIWAGITAFKQNDIKKILAFSTVSQLGFMFLGIASGNIQAAFFHLVTHAFFKSSLFLSAGLIINQQAIKLKSQDSNESPGDIRFMHNFWNTSPFLSLLVIMGAMALSALPLFSGFLSKEAIIAGLEGNNLIFSFALIATLITALYTGRMVFHLLKPTEKEYLKITFNSDLRSNLSTYLPIIILVILSLSIVYSINPIDYSNSWLYKGLEPDAMIIEGSSLLLVLSVFLTLGGFLLSYVFIIRNHKDFDFTKPLDEAIQNGFYLDKLLSYSFRGLKSSGTGIVLFVENSIIERIIGFLTYSFVMMAMIFRLFDTNIVNGLVKAMAGTATFIGEITRQFQGGKLRNYLFWLILFIIIAFLLIF
ncbi:MAG: proton-conducting transporter membrane subunit [Cytophagales bacterium]